MRFAETSEMATVWRTTPSPTVARAHRAADLADKGD